MDLEKNAKKSSENLIAAGALLGVGAGAGIGLAAGHLGNALWMGAIIGVGLSFLVNAFRYKDSEAAMSAGTLLGVGVGAAVGSTFASLGHGVWIGAIVGIGLAFLFGAVYSKSES